MLIITAGRYPVPAVKGGAVATLVEHLIEGNSNEKQADLIITSPYDDKAVKEAKKYKNCTFEFIKIPKILTLLETISYKVFHLLFPNKNLISIKSIFSFSWFVFRNGLLLKKNNYDYVVVENTARLFLCFKLFGNRKKYAGKILYHLHNEPKNFGGCESIIKECKAIICVSEYIKKTLSTGKNKLQINDSNKIKVLYNCIDTEKFKKVSEKEITEFKNKLGIGKEDRVLLFSGRIDNEKGILETLEALDYIKSKNFKLLIVGSSFYGMNVKTPFEEKIMEMAEKNKDRVIFTGFLDYSKMPLAYSTCDIAILPSMWEEPAGLTIIETMACKKAVITTKSGGIPEYANSESVVLLERVEDISKNIAKNVDILLTDEKKRSEMGTKARQRVVENFDSRTYIKKLIKLIKDN